MNVSFAPTQTDVMQTNNQELKESLRIQLQLLIFFVLSYVAMERISEHLPVMEMAPSLLLREPSGYAMLQTECHEKLFQRNENIMNVRFDWDEVDALITILHAKGISYLIGNGSSLSHEDLSVDQVCLIKRLAACGYPLVENASISLFILHPDLAPSVVAALQSSEGDITENIAVVTLATLYLQQWWFFRLAFALGRLPCFPEAPFVSLWEERNLPSPGSGYGWHELLALQEYQQRRYGLPLNFLDDWQNQINHLLAQEEACRRELSHELKDALVQLSI
jgi:hypothetical protein